MSALPLEIANFFLAMQAGPDGRDLLRACFAENATYTEPFSGQTAPHEGREAIVGAFAASRSEAFDDAVIQLGKVSVSDHRITVAWTCISKAIPGGRGSGTNVFQVKDGEITSLVTTLDGMPGA